MNCIIDSVELYHRPIYILLICGGKWERRLQILLIGQHTLCNTSYCQSSTMPPQKLRFSTDHKRPSCKEECDRPNGDDESEQCARVTSFCHLLAFWKMVACVGEMPPLWHSICTSTRSPEIDLRARYCCAIQNNLNKLSFIFYLVSAYYYYYQGFQIDSRPALSKMPQKYYYMMCRNRVLQLCR